MFRSLFGRRVQRVTTGGLSLNTLLRANQITSMNIEGRRGPGSPDGDDVAVHAPPRAAAGVRWPARAVRALGRAAAVLGVTALLAACDDTFEPFQDLEYPFSIYGQLDPAADTQWIRVTSIRTRALTEPGPIDAVVTLEHLGTGKVVELKDSVFKFAPVNLGGEPLYAHNFSTTEPIEPGATYRLTARRSDGATATAVVKIPKPYTEFVVRFQQGVGPQFHKLRVIGEDPVGLVHVVYSAIDACPFETRDFISFQVLPQSVYSGELPELSIEATRKVTIPEENKCLVWNRNIRVISTGVPWPFHPALDVFHMSTKSNVEGGIGWVGGIYTQLVPFEDCQIPDAPSSVYCEVRYHAGSATVRGRVRDQIRGGTPMPGLIPGDEATDPDVFVVVREVNGNKVRNAIVDHRGNFRVGGLEPGVPYELEACPNMDKPQFQGYNCRKIDLLMEPGEVRDVEVMVGV